MELSTLRYFVAVAEEESVSRAAERIPVSRGSLTKAIQRLERELGVKLFVRRGRTIHLSERGRELLAQARGLLRQEEEARLRVAGLDQSIEVVAAGEEALLGSYGTRWLGEVLQALPGARFELRAAAPDQLFARLRSGEVQVGFTTLPVPSDLSASRLGEVHFVTCVGRGHPLARRRRVAIDSLLEHGFAVPSRPILGATGALQSNDGWRDDAFPRRVLVRAETLHQLLAVADAGAAVAYLPDYLAEGLGLKVLEVTGCDYACVQPVHRVLDRRRAPGWLLDLEPR